MGFRLSVKTFTLSGDSDVQPKLWTSPSEVICHRDPLLPPEDHRLICHVDPFLYSIGGGGVQSLRAKSLQSCQPLCNAVDCSPPGSSVCGISQARILEWAATSSSGDRKARFAEQIFSYALGWGRQLLSSRFRGSILE